MKKMGFTLSGEGKIDGRKEGRGEEEKWRKGETERG
jgi:hypothetical protein